MKHDSGRTFRRLWRAAIFALLVFAPTSAPVAADKDALDALRAAMAAFRGIGYADVSSYRATFELPDESEDDAVKLEEIWRAPGDFAVRAAQPAAVAVVRSYAIFLEPLYVARSSILDADLDRGMERVRKIGKITTAPRSGGGSEIHVALPVPADSTLPGFLRDVSRIDALLDAKGRLSRLRLEFPVAPGRKNADSLVVVCGWDDARARQPSQCTWQLPDGGEVNVTTTFRDEGGKRVPGVRHVVFPSRYDPGESEEIRIEYGKYRWSAPAELLRAKGTFRYDAGGLVSE